MKKIFSLSILFALVVFIQAQTLPTLWGTTTAGGTLGNGTIYKLRSDDSNFSVPYNFGTTNQGWGPYGSLVQASNGLLYGMTSMGGANGGGVIFFIDPATNTYTEVHQFDAPSGSNSGSESFGSLIQANDGLLYGTTFAGGLNGDGVIFSFDPTSNTYSDRYDFIVAGNKGNLMQASGGLLYGMTQSGGNNFLGSLYSFDPVANTYTDDLFDFSGDPSMALGTNYGGNPSGAVIQGLDGNLYGTTGAWGVNDFGVIFSYNITTQVYTDLVDFTGTTGSYIGANPDGDLLQTSDGTLYGLTTTGGVGSDNNGVLFSYTISPAAYNEIDFNGGNGVSPFGNLIQDTHNGLLYGMASGGGAYTYGDIFSLDPTNFIGGITDRINFDNSNIFSPGPGPGATPYGSLVQANNGDLYGMTNLGGPSMSYGNVFYFDPVAVTETDIIDLLSGYPYTGGTPTGMLQAGNGLLYGVTNSGGLNGQGVLFSLDPVKDTLIDVFNLPFISSPWGQLMLASNGKMYGLTLEGGPSDVGNLFSLDTLGNYTDLYDFGFGSIGNTPLGTLVQANNGLLYGTTSTGGSGGAGVVFSFDPANPGNPPVHLYSFTGGTDGGSPGYGNSLVQASNGSLYGMTEYGGTGATPGCNCQYGVVFSYDITGNSYNVLWSFDGVTGGNPTGSLVQANNGLLYGMTNGYNSGVAGGNLFSIDALGNFTDIVDFSQFGSDGYNPGSIIYTPLGVINGSLWVGSDGNLYGTTTDGGFTDGELFNYNYTTPLTDISDFQELGNDIPDEPVGNVIELRNITDSAVSVSVCADSNINVPFVAAGFYTYANVFTAQLSDASGSFSSPVTIGTFSGTRSDTIHASLLGISPGTGYRIRVVSSNPNFTGADNGSDISIGVCAPVNTWLGGTTDWNTPGNWSLGTVPACADIEDSIPVTANDPIISVAENASNLVIDDNVTLTVNAALSVCGNLTGGSSRFATIQGSTALTLTGTALQTISGKLAFQNPLALDNTFGTTPQAKLSAGATVDIYDAVVLQNNNTLDVSLGTLALKSTSVNQAGIIDNFSGSNSGSISGNIVAERFYASPTTTNSYNQHEIGSPVNSPALSQFGASGTPGYVTDADCDGTKLDISSPYGTVFGYDETHGSACGIQQWKVLTGGNAVNGVGYSIRSGGPGTLSLTGAPTISGNVTVSGTNSGWTNSTLQGYPEQSGWTLASNPYPANLHISAGSISNNVDAGWDGVGVMVWNTTGGSAGSYQLTTTLAPFQAFMVHIAVPGTQSSPTSATYTIYATDRATSTTTFYKEAIVSTLNITATNQSSGLIDLTTVGFNQNATNAFDPSFDVHKIAGDPDRHTLYTLSNGNWMCQNINQSISETPTVPVGFSPGVSGTYSLHFDGVNSFDATSYITLEDTKLNIFHDVRSGDYVFTADVNDGWNRFVLHFTPPASINTTNATCSEQGMINIVQPGTAVWNYTLADNNNAILSSGTLNTSSPVSASVPVGVYNLTLKDNNGYTVVKTVEVGGVQPVVASFTASASSVNVNQPVTLSSTSAATALNSWNFGDGTTDNGATVTHSYNAEGVYNITLNSTNASGCNSSVSNTITVTRSTTGVTGLNDINSILIWSNEDIVNVDFTQLSEVQANIEIYNILGQKLSEDKYVTSSVYRKEIPNIEEGYIVVSVKNNDEIITKKLFITNLK